MCGMPMGLTALAGSLILRLTHGPWPCGRLKPYTTNPTHPTQACTSHHTCKNPPAIVSQTGLQARAGSPDPSGGKAVRCGRDRDSRQGRRAGRKADGTLDRRLKANRAGRGGEAGGEDGEGDGRSGGGGGGGEGIGPDQQPPPPPVAGEKRRRVATSRWQARALDEFDSAVRVARRDGVT